MRILGLDRLDDQVLVGTNLDSKKFGKKGIIKVSNTFFKDEEINKIALIAPFAKLNIINNYAVTEKKEVEIPNQITGIVRCFNPRCITNHEPITTRFTVTSKSPISLKCHYCEKITDQEHLQIF